MTNADSVRSAPGFNTGREFICSYVYLGRNGIELFRKDRYQLDAEVWRRSKDFRLKVPKDQCRAATGGQKCSWQREWERRNGYPWAYDWHPHGPKGMDGALYLAPDLKHAYADARPLNWTEGEKDAEAVVAAGGSSTSHWQAAGNATAEQAAWIAGLERRVIVWADVDEEHPEVGAYCAVRRHNLLLKAGLSAGSVDIVRARCGKDAADHLERYGLEDAVPVDKERIGRVAMTYVPTSRRGWRGSSERG